MHFTYTRLTVFTARKAQAPLAARQVQMPFALQFMIRLDRHGDLLPRLKRAD